MEKKAKAAVKATEANKDAALKESFAEIKKAAEEKVAEVKAAVPAVKKEAEQKAEAVKKVVEAKKEAVKKAAPAVKKEAVKKAAPAVKKEAAKKEDIKTTISFEFNGKQVKALDVKDKAIKAYLAKNRNTEVKTMEIYIVAAENAAYYVVNGVASEDFKIDL